MKFFPLIFILYFLLFAFHLLFANFFKYIFSTFHFWLIFAFKPLDVHAYVYGILPPFHLLFSFHVLILHILVVFTFTLLINSFPFLTKIFFDLLIVVVILFSNSWSCFYFVFMFSCYLFFFHLLNHHYLVVLIFHFLSFWSFF